jgi:4'-phosphopantetheinyl transferase EntD
MHDAHRKAAEQHEKGEYEAGRWHAERALQYSDRAYQLAKEAHTKSGQIVRL